MIVTNINGEKRYSVELSPGFVVETRSLDTLLTFLLQYGGYND